MNQFKDVFLGFDKRPYNRATTSQKCIRAAASTTTWTTWLHRAAPHLLRDAGQLQLRRLLQARRDPVRLELLTVHFKLPKDKLWVTVYSEDDEAYQIWNEVWACRRAHRAHIRQQGRALPVGQLLDDGDTGPCGRAPRSSTTTARRGRRPPGSPEQDGDATSNLNNVFMQFNRTEDGVMHPLPKPSVDTGMGLERLAACCSMCTATIKSTCSCTCCGGQGAVDAALWW